MHQKPKVAQPNSPKRLTVNDLTLFRIIALICGSVSLSLGWGAISEGYWWHAGYNPKLGQVTTGPTLAWVVYGVILLVAGVLPWRWLLNRRKR
jgi:hypothetical protein